MNQLSSADGRVELGLGLLSIGRAWGFNAAQPPGERDARSLLDEAVALRFRFFDTAPAYGPSERIFGDFLRAGTANRNELFVATKMGEHWSPDTQSAHTDHSYPALRRSLDRSLELLGRIDLLQVHKASASALQSDEVLRALDYARSLGIHTFGASVSDTEAARLACESGVYAYLQFPFNALSAELRPIFNVAARYGIKVIVNRPFAMGRIVHEARGRPTAMRKALEYILGEPFTGVILTGIKSPAHLRETVSLFRRASSRMVPA
jgi:aryl-alcohol dehydrogenase-like predicted oxidoreductase